MKHADYKKHADIGPGGMRCVCCGPAPGKPKKACLRAAKRREKQQAATDIKQIIADSDSEDES